MILIVGEIVYHISPHLCLFILILTHIIFLLKISVPSFL